MLSEEQQMKLTKYGCSIYFEKGNVVPDFTTMTDYAKDFLRKTLGASYPESLEDEERLEALIQEAIDFLRHNRWKIIKQVNKDKFRE